MLNRVIRLQRKVREAPTSPALWCELALAREAMGEHDEAVSDAGMAARYAEDKPETWITVGECFEALGELERAREAYRTACTHDPSSAEVHLKLGLCVLAEGNAEVAATVLATAVWLAPEDAVVQTAMGRALLKLGSYSLAAEHLSIATSLAPETPEPWIAQADLCQARDDLDGEARALRKAFETDPRNVELGLRFSTALSVGSECDEAHRVLEDLLSRGPNDQRVLVAMGRCELDLNRLDAAATTFRRATRLGESKDAYLWLGIALMKLHREVDAVDALREAERIAPTDGDVCYNLGDALYAIDETGEALSVLTRGALADRDDVRIQTLLARICQTEDGYDSGSYDVQPERALVSINSRSSEMAFTGDLSQFNLIDLLEFLRLNRRTGALRMASRHGVGEIMLVEGRLVAATTTNTGRLGDILVDDGLLSVAELDSAMESQKLMAQATPLGRILLDANRVSPTELRRILSAQIQQTIAEVLKWGEGQFAFEADDTVRQAVAHPQLELDTSSIMLEVLRILDEAERFG